MNESGKASPIPRAIIVAGLLLGTTVAMPLLSPEYINPDLARRVVGIMMGCIVMLYANALPKQLKPLAMLRCSPEKEQALRRFTGISLVVGGAGYALAWMLAPIDVAHVAAAGTLGTSLMAVAVRYGALFASRTTD